MKCTEGIPWDSPTYSTQYNGTGWTRRMQVCGRYPWDSPTCTTQDNGTGQRHRMQVYGKYPWDSMGQDGQVGCKYTRGTHGISQDSPACPTQDNGSGRTLKMQVYDRYPWDFVGQSRLSYIGQQDRTDMQDASACDVPTGYCGTVSLVLHRTMGQDRQLGCKCMGGTHGIPQEVPLVLHRTMGQDRQLGCKCMGGTQGIPWDHPTCPTQDSGTGRTHRM